MAVGDHFRTFIGIGFSILQRIVIGLLPECEM
jgi:hypothetical protein